MDAITSVARVAEHAIHDRKILLRRAMLGNLSEYQRFLVIVQMLILAARTDAADF